MKWTNRSGTMIAAAIALILVIIYTFGVKLMSGHSNSKLIVFTNGTPDSADPLAYDSFANHVGFGSVNATLVSKYRLGQVTPEIAESWISNADHTEWTFKLRENFKYSDGSELTGFDVFKSWLRMAKIMKARHSNSGFFEFLKGYDSLTSTSTSIEGLAPDRKNIRILLTKPMPGLLDKISFGLYGVAYPKNFDDAGNWRVHKTPVITSGPYAIISWTDQSIVQKLRKNYPKELVHQKPIEEIEFIWDKQSPLYPKIDLAMGYEIGGSPSESVVFHGGPPSSIMFVRLLSWRDPQSVFAKKENRLFLRNKFYEDLEKSGFKPVRSFFPTIIKGIHELADSKVLPSILSGEIVIPEYPPQMEISDAIVKSTVNTATDSGLKLIRKPIAFKDLMNELLTKKAKTTWDLTRYVTGILATAPMEDVRFMFKSKEGIMLPDETGEILAELDSENANLQRVNELIWNQGLIWPVTHYSSGLWAKENLDFSQLNLVLPPTTFQWIGWK